MTHWLVFLMLTTPPPVRDHFRAAPTTHAFLVVEVESGEIVRADIPDVIDAKALPLGDGERFLAAMAALEKGTLVGSTEVECDASCWSRGTHGSVSFVTALAWECDTFFADIPRDEKTLREIAESIQLDLADEDGPPAATLREWTQLWRRFGLRRTGLRHQTVSQLMAAAGASVTSPRGVTRTLHDPARSVRAILGGDDGGAWVAGLASLQRKRRWAFALYVPGASPALATARCGHLLDETIRAYRLSTFERGGDPWTGGRD